ncbi:MAG: metallophosphoesterase [Ignavibacteria bacterium]|nr:metallophosphoesterase [Ignavibacteria bacterium]
MRALFVSDLHGKSGHFEKLFYSILQTRPDSVFIGGDILPNYYSENPESFVLEFLKNGLVSLKQKLNESYPAFNLILGNDDPADSVDLFLQLQNNGLINYIHNRKISFGNVDVYGYSFIPPTPFLLKDWEKYDVSEFVPRGSVSPAEGYRTVEVAPNIIKHARISDDLRLLTQGGNNFENSIFLFHAPPHDTNLDKIIANDIKGNKGIVGVGSIAIRRFIEKKQPLITLHGHIHESSALTGDWKDRIGSTFCYNASYEGDKLALVAFDTNEPENALRELM